MSQALNYKAEQVDNALPCGHVRDLTNIKNVSMLDKR